MQCHWFKLENYVHVCSVWKHCERLSESRLSFDLPLLQVVCVSENRSLSTSFDWFCGKNQRHVTVCDYSIRIVEISSVSVKKVRTIEIIINYPDSSVIVINFSTIRRVSISGHSNITLCLRRHEVVYNLITARYGTHYGQFY